MRLSRLVVVIVLGLAAVGWPAPSASAAPGATITLFPRGGGVVGSLTAGPDGNVWFTLQAGTIKRVTPTGQVTAFTLTSGSQPRGITSGPDGNLWFIAYDAPGGPNGLTLGRITPSGVVTEFPVPPEACCAQSIVAGPDGNLWFTTYSGQVGRATTVGEVTLFDGGSPGLWPGDMTVGPDGNIWYTSYETIGRVTPAGVITEFPVPNLAVEIAGGSDGNLWFAEALPPGGSLGRMTPTGTLLASVPVPPAESIWDLARGPDGAVWFTAERPSLTGDFVGRVDTEGQVHDFEIPTGASVFIGKLTAGPDGNVWFTTSEPARIGKLSLPGASFVTHTASPNPAREGETMTLSATVRGPFLPGTPTGTVRFKYDGANVGGSVRLVNGQASTTVVATGPLALGHGSSVTYSGDATFLSSVSPLVRQRVQLLLVLSAEPAAPTFNLTANFDRPDGGDVLYPVIVDMTDTSGGFLCTASNVSIPEEGRFTESASCSVADDPAKIARIIAGGGYVATVRPESFWAPVSAHGPLS